MCIDIRYIFMSIFCYYLNQIIFHMFLKEKHFIFMVQMVSAAVDMKYLHLVNIVRYFIPLLVISETLNYYNR